MANIPKNGMTFLAISLVALCLGPEGHATLAQTPGESLQFYDVQVLNTIENRACQHIYEDGEYRLAWQSGPLDYYRSSSVRMGDIDNDGAPEIVASGYYIEAVGTKKNQTTYYYTYRIQVFEQGAAYDGGPSWTVDLPDRLTSTLLRDSWIGDVDNDGFNEIVLLRSGLLDIGKITYAGGETGAIALQRLKCYPSALDSLDIGDADNLPGNEIVVEAGQQPWVWKNVDGQWIEHAVPVDPVPYGDADVLNLTHVRIRDVDNDDRNEIISTGTNERLIVWRWDGNAYGYIGTGPDLIGNMAYGLDCGNVNGDKTTQGDDVDEVVIDVWSIRAGRVRLPSRVVALVYDAGSFVIENTFSSDLRFALDLRVADLTGDGRAEVILNDDNDQPTLRILTFEGDDLQAGSFREVYRTPTDPMVRIEVGQR